MTEETVHNITIRLAEEPYQQMLELAQSKDTTIAGLVREALAQLWWVEDFKARGGKLVAVHDGEKPKLLEGFDVD